MTDTITPTLAQAIAAASIYAAAAEAAVARAATQGDRLVATSSTPVAIGTGSKIFAIAPDRLFVPGVPVSIISRGNPLATRMGGHVTGYENTALTVDVGATVGTGAASDWLIVVSGEPGTAGPPGPSAGLPSITLDGELLVANGTSGAGLKRTTRVPSAWGLARLEDAGQSAALAALGALPAAGGTLTGALVLAGDAAAPLQPVTKQQFEAGLLGLKPKQSVRAATTANITLSAPQTIDGVALVAGDRVLVKDQTTASQNGLYVVGASTWQRALDADTWAELVAAFVFIEEGSTQADTAWICTVNQGGTLGTTAVTVSQFGNTVIPVGSVTNNKLAAMATGRLKGRASAGSGDLEDLTGAQATALLDAMVGDSGSGGTKGLVGAPAAGDGAAGKAWLASGVWGNPTAVASRPISTKTANYTTVAGDRGKLINATSGSATLSLLAAATATAGFTHEFKNSGPGVWTIDPNGSETIDGRTTILVYPGESFELACDGSNWITTGRQRLVLINNTVISGSPTQIDWTLGLADPEIDESFFSLRGVTLNADGILACRFGPSGGVYTSDYEYSAHLTTGSAVTYIGASAASSVVMGFAAKRSFGGEITLRALNALAAKTPTVNWWILGAASASASNVETVAGGAENGVNSGSALATFRLMTTTGTPTFSAGTISQWGRRA